MRKYALPVCSVLLVLTIILVMSNRATAPVVETPTPNKANTGTDLFEEASSSESKIANDTSTTTENTVTSTTPKPISTNPNAPFGHPENFTVGKNKIFADGLTVTLKNITDSRCPTDTECIWSGEINATFTLSEGSLTSSADVSVGSVRSRAAAIGSYTLTLATSTASSTSIIITSTAVSPALGQISGKVTISPLCSVEHVDKPCATSPETYTARSVVVYKNDLKTIYTKQPLLRDGTFSIRLEAGSYGVQILPAGIKDSEVKTIVVEAFKNTEINFTIDSGIR